MSARTFLFTSESVTEGHPDKIADQISDSVLDAVLAEDPAGRVACETLVTTGLVVVAGEISTETYVDVPRLARDRIREIGYTSSELGLDADTCGVITSIQEQSKDIARGVDRAYEVQQDPSDDDPLDLIGAGDQGMMFGYACIETPELMPLPIMLAHQICRRLAEVRKAGTLPYLCPDGKAMVTVRYEAGEGGHAKPIEIDRLLVVSQHVEGVDIEGEMKPAIIEHVLEPVLPAELYDPKRARRARVRARQSDREVRRGRPEGGHGAHRAQDHRRLVRRRRAAGRRLLLRARIRRRSTGRPHTPVAG